MEYGNYTPIQQRNSGHIPPAQSDVIEEPLWRDKRRPFFGQPWSFTTYTLYSDRLIIETGLLSLRQEEIRLYRLMDITMRQSLMQRIFRVGTIRTHSMDSTTPHYSIRDICFPREVMRLISDTANAERKKYGIGMMEYVGPNW